MRTTALGLLSAALTAGCVIPYLRDVARGTTRPQRTSWCVFATLAAVGAVSQLLAGADAGAWLSAGSAIGFGAVFVVSLRHGVGGWAPVDRAVLAVAAIGLALSLVASEPLVAIAAIVVAEQLAIALTVRKAYRDPESETTATWLIDAVAGLVAVAAVTDLSVTELLYPVHHVLVNAAVVTATTVGRSRVVGPADVRPALPGTAKVPEQAF